MNTIDLALEPITGYLISITRDTVHGRYELEIGIPSSWVFNQNDEISVEVLSKNDDGKLLKIFPKKDDIIIDDLIVFVEIIIETNRKIAEKEKQFTDRMEEMKGVLEKEAKKFYEELDELKENSFKNLSENFVKEKKETRGRKSKEKPVSNPPENIPT
jgi:hypothetical protein